MIVTRRLHRKRRAEDGGGDGEADQRVRAAHLQVFDPRRNGVSAGAAGACASCVSATDPRRYNGAVFLGLNGVAVKSHGGTDAYGFANAIGVAVDMVKHDFIDQTQAVLASLAEDGSKPKAAAV